jgi:hypothetical protein
MSLTCSVLGCDFGAVEQEQERTERSDEVIITRREAQTCERCGRKRVLSESKEVTAIEDARASAGAAGGAPTADTSGGAQATSPGTGDPSGAAGDSTDATTAAGSPGTAGTAETSQGGAAEPTSGPGATADQGAATEQGGAERGGDPGAGVGDPWNSVEDTGNATAHIESVGDSEDAAPDGDDAEIIESEPSDDPSAPPGRDPASPSAAESTGDDTGPDFPETEWAEATTAAGPGDEVEYDCPECGATHPSDGSSLRPGDICPDCQTGYLEERPVERNP